MKIVCTDNYDRESVADRLVAENVQSDSEAKIIVEALNATSSNTEYFVVRADDAPLWRGMEELV